MTDLIERLHSFKSALAQWPGNAPAAQAKLVGEAIAEIERLRKEADGLIELLRREKVKVEKLLPIAEAARDLTTQTAYWNPDTGNYDLYKSNGTLEQLIEALDEWESND